MSECVFCSIVGGGTPAEIVWDDHAYLAFLDIRPLFLGHTLVIPRTHHRTLSDLPREDVGPFFSVVTHLSRVVEDAMGAEGTFVALNNKVSQSVPHLHVHVVPRRPKDGLRGFFWPRTRYRDAAHIAEVGETIRKAL